jgi:hypothetical protein
MQAVPTREIGRHGMVSGQCAQRALALQLELEARA